MGICPIAIACEQLIAQHNGATELSLAQAIIMRHHLIKSQLLSKPMHLARSEWQLEHIVRNPTHLEMLIDKLAGKADLLIRSEKLMGMNPIEFANSFRDDELHFLLARKLVKLS